MALQPLSKPHIVRVKDLPHQRNGYTVFVKVLAIDRHYEMFKHGTLVPAIQVKVGDETATVLAIFCGKDIEMIKEGNVVCIRNGVKKYLNNRFLLGLDDFGRVTLQQMNIEAIDNHDVSTDVAGKYQKRPNPKGDYGRKKNVPKPSKPNYDRNHQPRDRLKNGDYQGNGDRKYKNNFQSNYRHQEGSSYKKDNKSRPMKDHRQRSYLEERREQSTYYKDSRSYARDEVANEPRKKYVEKRPQQENHPGRYIQKSNKQSERVWSKLNKVCPGEDDLNISVKILSVKVADHRGMLKCQVGDETGVSDAKLENQGFVKVGATINLLNAEAQVVYEHIELRSEKMEPSERRISGIERGFNLSAKAWVPKAD